MKGDLYSNPSAQLTSSWERLVSACKAIGLKLLQSCFALQTHLKGQKHQTKLEEIAAGCNTASSASAKETVREPRQTATLKPLNLQAQRLLLRQQSKSP